MLLQLEDDTQRVARVHELEGLLDLVEPHPVRYEPVEREAARAVEVERQREVALRLRRSVDRAEDAPLEARDRDGREREHRVRAGDPDENRRAPPPRVEWNAASIASGRPVASTATSTPPPETSFTASAVASGLPAHATVCVAPKERATSSFCGMASTATMGSAPAATAAMSAERPTPPQPITAKRSPGRNPAVRQTAPTPVETPQPTSAATSNGMSSAIGTHERSETTHASANVERKE